MHTCIALFVAELDLDTSDSEFDLGSHATGVHPGKKLYYNNT